MNVVVKFMRNGQPLDRLPLKLRGGKIYTYEKVLHEAKRWCPGGSEYLFLDEEECLLEENTSFAGGNYFCDVVFGEKKRNLIISGIFLLVNMKHKHHLHIDGTICS